MNDLYSLSSVTKADFFLRVIDWIYCGSPDDNRAMFADNSDHQIAEMIIRDFAFDFSWGEKGITDDHVAAAVAAARAVWERGL